MKGQSHQNTLYNYMALKKNINPVVSPGKVGGEGAKATDDTSVL